MEVIWDTHENIIHADQQVQFILSGCKCKAGCGTRRCKCKKEGRTCGAGCQCIHCTNSASTLAPVDTDLHELEVEDQCNTITCCDDFTDTSSDEVSDQDDLDDDVNTIMNYVFGEYDSGDEQ